MMTREHHRRRSPESSRRRRKERRDSREQLQLQHTPIPEPRYQERAEPVDLQLRAFSPQSSSSSTSSSLLNISRPSRFGLGRFFTGSGRKQHRVRKKRSRFLRFGNSSSSSVGSDLAYGKGYIERRRSREFSPPNSPGRRPALSRQEKTDEEIIELGRKFAEIARQQNAEDLRAAGRSRPTGLISAASALSQFGRTNSGHSNRGIGSSKTRRDSSPDDSEWESASDDDDDSSSSSEFDSGLAYGSGLSLQNTSEKTVRALDPPRPSRSPRSPRLPQSPQSPHSFRPPPSLHAPNHDSPLNRKPSVVDPNLFGPVNSLRGYVETPCGFEKVDRSKLDEPRRPYEPSIPPSESISETRPLQMVYPVPTSDPGRFDARGSVVSFQHDVSSPRPAPVPIQQPKPIAPVSRKVLDAVETDSRFSDRSSSRRSLTETAITSIASTALTSALSSDRRDDREKHEEKRDRDGKRRSKRPDTSAPEEKFEKRKDRDVIRDERRDEQHDEIREVRNIFEERSEKRREKRSEQDNDSEKTRRLQEMMAAEVERESEKEKRRRRDKNRDEGNDYDRERKERRERRDGRSDDQKAERKIDRKDIQKEARISRSDLDTYKRLDDVGSQPKDGPIDPFQFQVADDAFHTPLHTTPKRPLTPNVVTVDREPDFSRFERIEDHVRPLERLSRKDSYERDLRNAHEIYEAAEHATAPVKEAAFAAAAAAVIAEDQRGRSRSRGSDATSRNRSRRGESPKRDVVQEDADRYYREAELARRIQEEDRRSHGTTDSSVIDKWKQAKEPVVVDIVAPPEMDHPKKKSPYDGPDADVRIDNVLEHPSELSRFQRPNAHGLALVPYFKARDPSAERDRPMLNVVRPTPVPTPTLEVQRLLEEPPSETAADVDTDVVIGPRGEIIPASSTPKVVSWGQNQTKHYVVESPEREDDPYSGAKIVTPAKPPRSRPGRKNGWGVIAGAVGGVSNGAASSSSTDPEIASEAPKARRASRVGEKATSRRSSVQLEDMYDSPPIPGLKPPSPRSIQMPGTFAEDPAFTANIAAALQGSGFDPNIVIDNASFHRRESPPGSNDTDIYPSPFVEGVIDLGSTVPQDTRDHGFVIGEVAETPPVETPPVEQESTSSKSQILARLKEMRRQQGGPQGPEIFHDSKASESRSIDHDDWDTPSSKPSKKEKKRREKSISSLSTEENLSLDDATRLDQDLEAEFGVVDDEGQDASQKKKKSKKSKKAVVVQDSSKQPDMENPKVSIDASGEVSKTTNALPDVQDAKVTQQDAERDLPKESRRTSKRDSGAYESARSAPASELSMESSYRVIDTESAPATDDEWDAPRTPRRGSGAYSSLSRSAQASEISLELARRTTLPASRHDDEHDITPKRKNKRNTIDDEFSSLARSTDDLSRSSLTDSRRSSRIYDSPPREDQPVEDIVESPIEMTESFSDLRSEKAAATEEDWDVTPKKSKKKSKRGSGVYDDTPSTPVSQSAPSESSLTSSRRSKHGSYADSPSRSAPGSEIGTDDSRKKSKKKKRRSASGDGSFANEGDPPDRGRERIEALDLDMSSVVSSPSRYDDHKSSRSRRRGETLDDSRSVTSAPGSAERKDRKSSKSEKDVRNSGSSSFFDRFRSSIGIAEEKGRQRKSEEDKKNSFLDNAGTLGAGVGSTGADIAPVSQSRANATSNSLEEETQIVPTTPERQSTEPREVDLIDPEIVPREIRPAIDPKYGDLLPLPPSLPGSPVPELGDDFPPLPDSRPASPEHERHLHEMPTHARRRSGIETPHRPKTPSQGAIPLQFLLGHKATPESPIALKSPSVRSPSASPVAGISEFSERRRRPRPTSWESSREFKPLLLLQRAFREPTSMMNSPERESSPTDKLQEASSSRFEGREGSPQFERHILQDSPNINPQPRGGVSDMPVRSASIESFETPAISRTSESISHSPIDRVLDQPSNEALHWEATGADDTIHLPPLIERSETPFLDSQPVNVEHGVELTELPRELSSEPVEDNEPKSPKPELKLVVPSSDVHPSPHTIQELDGATIPPISPILSSVHKNVELDKSLQDSLEENFKDVTPTVKTATHVPEDVQVMTVLDHGSSQDLGATETLALHNKDALISDILPEGKTSMSANNLDTSENDMPDNGLAELSSFLETLHDDGNTHHEKEPEIKGLPEASNDAEIISIQDDAPRDDIIAEQGPTIDPFEKPTVQEPAAIETYTEEPSEIPEQVSGQSLKGTETIEAPLPEAPALESRDEPFPEEVPKEVVDAPQPEPETSGVQQTASTSKKGKKKKKNRKSQTATPILDDQPVIEETRDAGLNDSLSKPVEEITATPVKSMLTPAEGEPFTIKEESFTTEEPAAIEKEFAIEDTPITSEPEASIVQPAPVEEEPTVEKSLATEDPATIEGEFTVEETPDPFTSESNPLENVVVEDKPVITEEPVTMEKEFTVENPTTSEPETSTVQLSPVEKELVLEEKPSTTEEPAIEKEFDVEEKHVATEPEASTLESLPIEKELVIEEKPPTSDPELSVAGPDIKKEVTVEEKPTISKPEAPALETTINEPSSSAWSFWGATKKSTKKPKEAPQAPVADSSGSWLGWGKKKLKGSASDPAESKEPKQAVAKSELTATEKEVSNTETQAPVTQSETSAVETEPPSAELERTAADLDSHAPQHEPSALQLETNLAAPELEPKPAPESIIADLVTSGIEAESTTAKPEAAVVEVEPTIADTEPIAIAPEIASVEPEPNTANPESSVMEAELVPIESEFKDASITEPETIVEPETTPTEVEPTASNLESVFSELEPKIESQADSTDIVPVSLYPPGTETELATVEPAAREAPVPEPELVVADANPAFIESEPASAEPEVVVEPGQATPEQESAAIEKEAPSIETDATMATIKPIVAQTDSTMDEAELMSVNQESAAVTREPVTEEAKTEHEQPAPTSEASTSVSKKGKKKKKKAKQQSSLEEELGEPSTPQEKSTKTAELPPEDNLVNSDTLPAEPNVPAQDVRDVQGQPEVAVFEEPPNVQENLPEEPPVTPKKSKKKKKGKKGQILEVEPEAETAIEQASAQKPENQPLPLEAKSDPTVQEAEATTQADSQVSVSALEHISEFPTDHQETEVKLEIPDEQPVAEAVPFSEPLKPDETSHDIEEIPRQIPSASGLFEPLSSNPEVDGPHEHQSAPVSDATHGQQLDSTSEPILEKDQLRGATNEPEDLVLASVVQEDLNNDQEHEGEPTWVGASLQGSVEQETSGSKSLEHIADDESPLQPNLPSGEDSREQDPASIDPLETPLSGATPTENLQNKSIEQQTEAVEEPALKEVVDDAHPSPLLTESVAEKSQEMALSQEDISNKKKGKKNKKRRQDTSDTVETPIVTETQEEPTPQTAEPEASLDELVAASDVLEQTVQKPTELVGDESLQLPSRVVDISNDEQDGQGLKTTDPNEISEVSKPEDASIEPSVEPQADVETVQKSAAEQTESIGHDVGPEAGSSSKKSKKKKGKKNRQSVDEPALSIEPEPSQSVEQPAIKDTTEETATDRNQSTDVVTGSLLEIDVAADGPSQKEQAPEATVDNAPSKKKSKKDKKKRSSAQLELPVNEETPEEPLENIAARDKNNEATPPTESTLDVDPTTGNKQTSPAQEIDESKAPETSIEPSPTSEELAQAPKDSDSGLTPITEEPKSDKPQSVQFAEPLEQDTMEVPSDIPIGPSVEFPETETTFDSDWASAYIPPPPDFSSNSESHQGDASNNFNDSLETHHESSLNPSVDPVDQLLETIESEKAVTPSNEDDKPIPQDAFAATVSEEPSLEENKEELDSAHVHETKDELPAETTPKIQPSTEIASTHHQSTDDQKPIEADIVEEPTTYDDSQITIAPTGVSANSDPVEVPHSPVEIRQLGEDQPKADDDITPQFEESTSTAPAISEDDRSRDIAEPSKQSEPPVEPIPSTEDSTTVTAEESELLAKKSKKDKKKKRKSKTQDLLDSTSGAATPAEEPTAEPPLQQIDADVATSQEQVEPNETMADIPMTAEPEQMTSESQPQEDQAETSVTKKGKKDKKKKKRASQIQEPEPESSSLLTEETPVEQSQTSGDNTTQLQNLDSSELTLRQGVDTQPTSAQEDLPDQPDLPVPETSETTASISEMPVSTIQQPELQPVTPADVPLKHEDVDKERAIRVEETSDDAPVVEAEPVVVPSVDSSNVPESHKRKEATQTSDATSVPEQGPIIEQPVLDEEPTETTTTPKSKKDKKKKKKKRDSQALPEDTVADPSQDVPRSTPSIATPVEDTTSVVDSTAPVPSEDVSVSVKNDNSSMEPSEPTESTVPVASQSISESGPDIQPATEIQDFGVISPAPAEPFPDQPTTAAPITELDIQDSEKVSPEGHEQGQDKEALLPDDNAFQQTPREQVEETIAVPVLNEQAETGDRIATGASKDEDTTESASTKKSKKSKKKKSNVSDDVQPQESTEAPQDSMNDIAQAETSTPVPQEISQVEGTAEHELPKDEADQEKEPSPMDDPQTQPEPAIPLETTDNSEQVEADISTAKEISRDEDTNKRESDHNEEDHGNKSNVSDEVRPQEEQAKVDAEPTATPIANESLEATVQAPEDSKDEIADDNAPTKKSKKSKKKKRVDLLEETPIEQQEPTSTTGGPATNVPVPEQTEIETPTVVENSKDEDIQDATPGKKSKKDKKKKKRASTLEAEAESQPPVQSEPDVISQPVEQPTETSHSDAPPMNLEDAFVADKSLSVGPSEMSRVATNDNEPPVASTQDNVTPFEESRSTEQPIQAIQEQVPEQFLENITDAPLTNDAAVDVVEPEIIADTPQPEISTQVPDDQSQNVPSSMPTEEDKSLSLTGEPAQLEESTVSEQPTHAEEHSKLEVPTEQDEPAQVQEPSKPEELSEPKEVAKVEEPTLASESIAQESVQTQELVQTESTPQEHLKTEESLQQEESLQPDEPLQPTELKQTGSLAMEEPLQQIPVQGEEPSKQDESAQLDKSPELEETKESIKADAPTQLQEPTQVAHLASLEPSTIEATQPEVVVKPEEPTQQEPLEVKQYEPNEEPILVEEPVQLEDPTQLAEQHMDEPEAVPARKTKKDKKKKKKASQAESDPVPESVQQLEEPQAEAPLVEQSVDQDAPKTLPEVAESVPLVEDPTTISKEGERIEEAVPIEETVPEATTSKKSKKKKKRDSQIVPELAPESALPTDGPAEQSQAPDQSTLREQVSLPEQFQEPQSTAERTLLVDEPAEQSSLPEQSSLAKQPEELKPEEPRPEEPQLTSERALLTDEPSLPEQSQDLPHHDVQPVVENTEEVVPETPTGKKSKKKKKRASQANQDPEANASTLLESEAQSSLLEQPAIQEPIVREAVVQEPLIQEPLVQEPQEQSDSQPKVQETEAVKEEENLEVPSEAVSSKKSKKEKRKAKKLASSTTEPEPEDNVKLEEQPAAAEVEPSYSQQATEPVDSVVDTATPLATEPTSTNPEVEHTELPATQVELPLEADKSQSADVTEKHEGGASESIAQEPEKDLTVSHMETETNVTSPSHITDVTAKSTPQPANASTEISTQDAVDAGNETRDELNLDVPDSALPSQDLTNTEKQDETVADKELAVTEEAIPAEPDNTPGPSETPKTSTIEQQEQTPAEQSVQLDDPLVNDQELESTPLTRKKSKKGKKKKKADTLAESEPASETQTPSTPVSTSDNVTKTEPTETIAGEAEKRSIFNKSEWPESLSKSKDKNYRTASGTSTPLESMEDAPVDAPSETVTEENVPGHPTLQEIEETEGLSSKVNDVQEEKYSEPKDKDVNAEDISFPTMEDVTVSENSHLASPAEEEQLVQPEEGPANENVQEVSDHVELSVPTPPRTPEPTALPPTIDVDLSPAQPNSHVEHEPPFDQSPQPGKKARIESFSDNTMIPVPLSARDDIPPQNVGNSTIEIPKLLLPTEQDIVKVEDDDTVPEDITPAREIAASYLESQPISMEDTQNNVKECNTEQANARNLLPVITPRREIAASYFEGHLHPEMAQADGHDMQEDNTQLARGSIPFPDVQPSQLDSERMEETVPVQPDEPRQSSAVQDIAPSAREVAAALMESHLKPTKQERDIPDDKGPAVTEDVSPMISTEDTAPSFEKSNISEKGKEKEKPVDKEPLDTDDMLVDDAPLEKSQSKELEGGRQLDMDVDDLGNVPTTKADDQTRAPSSPDAMDIDTSTDLPKHPAGQQNVTEKAEDIQKIDIESPIVGRDVHHELPKPRNAGHESPKSHEPATSEIIEKLDDLDTSEYLTAPTEANKTEDVSTKSISPTRSYMSSGRVSPRLLPPVEEETNEELEKERQEKPGDATDKATISTEANRDSGIANSPHPKRRSLVDPSQRDSGVHLHDWPESIPKTLEESAQEERGVVRTPQPNERRSKKLGLGGETPKLSTPTVRNETQDTIDPKKTRAPSRTSTPSTTTAQESNQRSVSENLPISRRSTPLAERQLRRTASNTSISRLRTPEPHQLRPESPSQSGFRSGTNTPPLSLRRVGKRMSGDLRSLSSNLSNNVSKENLHQSQTQPSTTPVANEGRVRAKDMTDVYDGIGEGRIGSPRSPTRPQSVRRRQSMQVLELESKVEQLIVENRALSNAKLQAEQNLNNQAVSVITDRDAEIESLKASLEWLRKEVTRLTEVNEGLNSANNVLALQHTEKYGQLESRHASTAKELDEHRAARGRYYKTLEEKDAEIRDLRAQLEATKEQVREMQRQILATKPPDADFLRLKDEDHFDHRCQQLCSHVQQWVLRFSKFSDMRACRRTSEINDEKVIDRLDNSVLDGSDVDDYLRDRVKRRDIFMSMTMNMIWEFVFTRYLFGMDREQRQKLKSLEKLLMDVGPLHAVRQWRAVTLTLLSKRPAFGDQRNQDTEAVVQAIFQTLCMILPPPSNLEAQIQSQLRRVMREAVDLSIEMRTQRAEYMMLPPLQPEYDGNGDLARTVTFNGQLMNERSGSSVSNDEYEAQAAVVRTVLFPLVVKKGDDNGIGEDEIVICPAQVLVAKSRHLNPHGHVRMATPASEGTVSRGATPSVVGVTAQSVVSLQMTDAPPPQPTPPHDQDYI